MNKELRSDLEKAFKELNNTISQFSDHQINIIPFEGSWTAGEAAQHLILSGDNIGNVLKRADKEPGREPDANIEKLRNIFLDYSTQMKAPEFIEPEKKDYNKDEQLAALKNIEAEVLETIDTLDLNKLCTEFEFPGIGNLTRLEIINFINFHTQRHTHQLRNILEKLK
ncbi:hypothetical protein BH10BAC5_BH10BAC5_09870 [soil metagenome]